MKYKVFFILLLNVVCLTCAKPTDDDPFPLLVPGGGIGGIFKGANKETIIQGPDGSVITAENEPGIIVQSHELKEPKKETVVAEQPIATVEKIATIVKPIKPVVQNVQPIVTASKAPTQFITSNNDIDDFSKADILSAPIARGSVLESKRILVPRPKPSETTIVEQPSQPVLFTPQQTLLPVKFSYSTLAPQQDPYAPKISLAPQKITLSSTPAPPVLSASTIAPPVLSSTLSPRVLSSTLEPQIISSTFDPRDLQGFSSTIGSENLIESERIDLGGGDIRIAIPVVEYASSNGFVNNARAEILGLNVPQTTARINDISNVNWVTGSPLKDTQVNIEGSLEDNEIFQQPRQFYATQNSLPTLSQSSGLFPLRLSASGPNNLAELDISGNNRNLYQAGLSDVRPPPPMMLPPPRKQFLTLEDKIESDLWSRYGRDTKKSRK